MRSSKPFLLLLASLISFVISETIEVYEDEAIENVRADEVEILEERLSDEFDDSFFDGIQPDPDCENEGDASCYQPPPSTIEEDLIKVTRDASCTYGGEDPDQNNTCTSSDQEYVVDKHWGDDPTILQLRNALRQSGSGQFGTDSNGRPPIFLLPGLAATRLVAWRYKSCSHHPLLTDVKVQDYVWLNLNMIMQMKTLDLRCFAECFTLGLNQSDNDDASIGCKLRPDEGLDAISSLAPGGISSQLLVGGTNTVYSWLIQWLADNLGYDVTSIIGLPYDWRLSPNKMEQRDGFMTQMRRRIEAAVQSNGAPGIMVAHSMGNLVFRYFLHWLLLQFRKEALERQIRICEITSALKSETSEKGGDRLAFGVKPAMPKTNTTDHCTTDILLVQRADQRASEEWKDWIEKHIWTYVGLSAPVLGAVNPLRSVISGESMGLPVTEEYARAIELSFGSTNTLNPVSTSHLFCDEHKFNEWDEEPTQEGTNNMNRVGCWDDVAAAVEQFSNSTFDPWKNFPALKALLRERNDWDTDFRMMEIIVERCSEKERKEKLPCNKPDRIAVGPIDAENGRLFSLFSEIWKEKGDPLRLKFEQMQDAFWNKEIPNLLTEIWDRPPVKHVIMAYGTDRPTEVGYTYVQRNANSNEGDSGETPSSQTVSGVPVLQRVIWEVEKGQNMEQRLDARRSVSITDLFAKKEKRRLRPGGTLPRSGDGSVPYLSLSVVHLWLLQGVRSLYAETPGTATNGIDEANKATFDFRNAQQLLRNPLDSIAISHRPQGEMKWVDGPPPRNTDETNDSKASGGDDDTGTFHPHGTKYKPEMLRYHSSHVDEKSGVSQSTTVIEALGVEHKETTRNYDILAAVFTEILQRMHDDLDIV